MNRSAYIGLVFACPHASGYSKQDTNPADCPLHDLRTKLPADRVRWWESRTDEELEAIIATHLGCKHNPIGTRR